MNLGSNIRALRKARGLTLEEVGNAVGIKRASVSAWESSDTRPDLDRLVVLARLFGVTVDQLLSSDMEKRGIPATKETSATDSAWPFKFSRARYDQLTSEQKHRIELLVLGQISEWAERNADAEHRKAG